MENSLYYLLEHYGNSDYYPFHMPGHKRSSVSGPLADYYAKDITEIDGFDYLYRPEGILLKIQQKVRDLYGSEESFLLVNGSTVGILSAISATNELSVQGLTKKIIIARNSHKSVYHGVLLNSMEAIYIYPEYVDGCEFAGGIRPEEINRAICRVLEDNRKAIEGGLSPRDLIVSVVITSPTYEGVQSDVEKIAEEVHKYGIPLIVDQAHGAHFGVHPLFPESAVKQGADIVIHSLHKTLPSPTQTALLHVNGELVDRERIRGYLEMYQTSSPSYPLMAGIESCMDLVKREGYKRLEELIHYRLEFFKRIEDCIHIKVYPSEVEKNKIRNVSCDADIVPEPGKLILSVRGTNMTGRQLYDCLRKEYHLQMEMASGNYVVGILSMMDNEEGFKRLSDAIHTIDKRIECVGNTEEIELFDVLKQLRAVKRLDETYLSEYDKIGLNEADGYISADFIGIYPPGIPIVVPGERINKDILKIMQNAGQGGYLVQGIDEAGNIKVLKNQ